MTAPITSAAESPAPAAGRQQTRLAEAAQAFEAIFLRQMLSAMRDAKLADDPLANAASDQFRDMGDAGLADSLSSHGFGIARMLLQQFTPLVRSAETEGRVDDRPA